MYTVPQLFETALLSVGTFDPCLVYFVVTKMMCADIAMGEDSQTLSSREDDRVSVGEGLHRDPRRHPLSIIPLI